MIGKHKSQILFAFTIAVALCVAYLVRHVLFLIYVSILFAVVLTPLVDKIRSLHIGKWHPGKGLAIGLIVLAGLVIVGLFGAYAIPPMARDLRQLATDWPTKADRVLEYLHRFPVLQDIDPNFLQEHAGQIAGSILKVVPNVAGAVLTFFTFLIFTTYFIIDGKVAADWIVSLFPNETRPKLHRTLWHAKDRMRKWMTGQLLLMLILGVLSAIVYGLLGLRYFTVLAVFTGVANIVPIVGPVASILLAALVAASDSWVKILAVLGFYAAYQQLENAYLSPRIMHATVGLPPLAIIIALALGGEIAGPVGALVAVPSAAVVAVLTDEYLAHANNGEQH